MTAVLDIQKAYDGVEWVLVIQPECGNGKDMVVLPLSGSQKKELEGLDWDVE